jgi:hypothetical protein
LDLVTFFLRQHAAVHASDVSGASLIERVFGGLSDEQLRLRPGPRLNSLVWLLWHLARTIGTGMTTDEVTEMSTRADVAAVRAYRSAVGRRTQEVVRALRPEAWDEIVEVPDIRRAAAAGALRDWVEGASYPWLGWTRAEQLASSALRHNSAHIGEAVTIRSLAGVGLDI